MAGTGDRYSRREFGRMALMSAPVIAFGRIAAGAAEIKSRISGVQIGAISYSFNRLAAEDIVKAFVTIGLGEMELMSNHAEALAGAPAGRGGGGGRRGAALTPEEQAAQQAAREGAAAALKKWRSEASAATFAPVRRKIADAGIDPRLLCYNMNSSITDEDIEYGFMMAKWLGAKAMTTSTQVSMAKRIAPFAEKHRMTVGVHGHDQTDRPDEVHNEASFEAVMAAGKYMGANLDIGHYTAANGDAVAFIRKHHARITNLHVKDMKRNHGTYTPFGEGDAPIKDVLQLMRKERYDFPGNIEFEYGGDPLVEVPKCFDYVRRALEAKA